MFSQVEGASRNQTWPPDVGFTDTHVVDALTFLGDWAATVDADDAEVREWAVEAGEEVDDEWVALIAAERAAIAEFLEDEKSWAASTRDKIADLIDRLGEDGAWNQLHQWVAEWGPSLGEMLLDAQVFRDLEWITTADAARVYGCSPTYMRRLARREFKAHERRKHPDGGWRYLLGSVRQKRKRT